jgi:hypothetical protein
METMETKKSPKIPKHFCEYCEYITDKTKDFKKHLLTSKHKMETFGNNLETNLSHQCNFCKKIFKSRSGLWKHKKTCQNLNCDDEKTNTYDISPELILNIIQQNTEFKDMLVEQNKINQELQKQVIEICKNGTTNTVNNTVSNSNNKTFNLQLFLNETCKDAMNIMDFVDSIKFQLSDLESVGELGYVKGISNIIIRNLKALDENMRPVHCSDLRREKIYIKDADKWEKEGADNKILKNAIKYIAHKNVKMIPAFREKYPDCIYSDSRKSDQYNRLIIEAMGGDGNDEDGKANKIISKIAKEILIEK